MDDGFIILIFMLGLVLGIVGMYAGIDSNNHLSDATLKDVCHNLDNRTVGFNVTDGKLQCIIPSFDHTENIQIIGGHQ